MKELFDNCSERQLKKLKKILRRIADLEGRILTEANKANRFIPGVKVRARWFGLAPTVGLEQKVISSAKKGPKTYIVITPFRLDSMEFYETELRGRDVQHVNLTAFPEF